jgi:hypothetical protein
MHTLDLDRTEPESDSRGASLREFGGPQAPSCIDANIVMSKAFPNASHPILDFYFELIS